MSWSTCIHSQSARQRICILKSDYVSHWITLPWSTCPWYYLTVVTNQIARFVLSTQLRSNTRSPNSTRIFIMVRCTTVGSWIVCISFDANSSVFLVDRKCGQVDVDRTTQDNNRYVKIIWIWFKTNPILKSFIKVSLNRKLHSWTCINPAPLKHNQKI